MSDGQYYCDVCLDGLDITDEWAIVKDRSVDGKCDFCGNTFGCDSELTAYYVPDEVLA